jgi:hypothetical protein
LCAKREDLSADDLFSKVEDYYIEGIGRIDWAESVLAGTAAVLSLSPEHWGGPRRVRQDSIKDISGRLSDAKEIELVNSRESNCKPIVF